jgi:hypothetical protein
MPKQSGLGYTVSVDDNAGTLRDISNDITNFEFSTPRGVQDVTGVDKYAMERILLLADFSVTLNGVVNFDSNKSHDVFKTVTSSSAAAREINLTVSTKSMGVSPVITVLFTDYQWSRSDQGELTWSAPGVLANGEIPSWS